MTKEETDIELKEISKKLDRINKIRARLDHSENDLCLRRHTLMLEHYPEVIAERIEKVMRLRRHRRGY